MVGKFARAFCLCATFIAGGGLAGFAVAEPVPRPASGAGAIERTADFAYRLRRAERPGGEVLVLLHGSGGDEESLVRFALGVAPRATLLGVRGRARQDGVNRWYRRITPVTFDQADIRAEAAAFADFIRSTAVELGLDLRRATFLGYSNGANLIAAMALLDPGIVRRAVLLRAMPVLDRPPAAPLRKMRVLVIAGTADTRFASYAPILSDLLRRNGATVDQRSVEAGHAVGEDDRRIVAEWLAALASSPEDGAPDVATDTSAPQAALLSPPEQQ